MGGSSQRYGIIWFCGRGPNSFSPQEVKIPEQQKNAANFDRDKDQDSFEHPLFKDFFEVLSYMSLSCLSLYF